MPVGSGVGVKVACGVLVDGAVVGCGVSLGLGVFVGSGFGVSVGRIVLVGGTGVLVGGRGVPVGGTGVLVACGAGVFVAPPDGADWGVLVAGTAGVGNTWGVRLGVRVYIGRGVAVGRTRGGSGVKVGLGVAEG
jgi:hypothetical protein